MHPPLFCYNVNKFCAACHNISDAVPWQLMINNTCKENLESSTVDEMLKIMVDRKCGSIEFRPFHTMAPRICPNVPRDIISYFMTFSRFVVE
jgi:hypothetical protein